jgi:uncharacterized protein (TIGR00725 family)
VYQVAVVGPGYAAQGAVPDAASEQERLAYDVLAYDVGERLARLGVMVVTGGLGGVMAAASRGAVTAGGLTLGLLPGTDPAGANPWVRVVVPTGLGEARNALVVRSAQVLVAIGGGWGTLSEVALALKAEIPVVGLRSWAPAGPDPAHPEASSPVRLVASADGAVTAVADLLGTA